jgi:hypothetical protein
MGILGVEIMNSTAFLLLSKSNSKIDGNQITFEAVDFKPRPPTLALVIANLDQELYLMIGSLNFLVGSLGSVCLLDLINLCPSAGKTVSAANSETSVGSFSETNSPFSIKLRLAPVRPRQQASQQPSPRDTIIVDLPTRKESQ